MTAIHGLIWLTRDEGVLTPTGTPDENTISSPDELDEGSYELHWFGSASDASSFRKGVIAVGANTIEATCGIDNAAGSVLLRRVDRERPAGTSLDDVVTLVEHNDGRNRRLNVTWSKELDSLRSTSKNHMSSFATTQIGTTDDRSLAFTFKYERWEKHPDFSDIKKGGVQEFKVIIKGNERYLSWNLWRHKNLLNVGRTRSKPYRDDLEKSIEALGGKVEGKEIVFPLGADLLTKLVEIIPVFSKAYEIDSRIGSDELKRKVYEMPEAQRIITLLHQGGKLTTDPKPKITLPSGKAVAVTRKIIDELERAKLIERVEGERCHKRLAEGVSPLEQDPYEVEPLPNPLKP